MNLKKVPLLFFFGTICALTPHMAHADTFTSTLTSTDDCGTNGPTRTQPCSPIDITYSVSTDKTTYFSGETITLSEEIIPTIYGYDAGRYLDTTLVATNEADGVTYTQHWPLDTTQPKKTFSLTAPASPGTYRIKLQAQAAPFFSSRGYGVSYYDTTGSTYYLTYTVVAQPNLTALVGPSATGVSGQSSTLTGTVSNIGQAGAGAFPNIVQVCDANCASVNMTLAATNVASLAPNASQAVSATYTPSSATQLLFRVCANFNTSWTNVITESNYGDNCSAWQTFGVQPVPPASITAVCSADGTHVSLSWPASNGATGYYPRVYTDPAMSAAVCNSFGWQLYGPDTRLCYPNPDAGIGGATSVTDFPITPGKAYSAWVHPGNASGVNWVNPPQTNFTCNGQVDLSADLGPQVNATAGQAVSLTGTAKNVGLVDAGAFPNVIQVCDSGCSTVDTHLAASNVSSLAKGASQGVSASYTPTTSNHLYYRTCSNFNTSFVATISESNYNNNCSAWNDLYVAPAAPTGLNASCNAQGTLATFTWNPSTGANSYYIRVFKSGISCPANWQLAPWDPSNNTCIPVPDPSGNSTTITFGTVVGQTYGWAVHGNNANGYSNPPAYGANFTCTASPPDLTASSITPTTAGAGVPVTLNATISNIGTGSTNTGFTDLFQRATDVNGTGATDIGQYSSAAIAANASNVASLSYTFPNGATTWYVRACADLSSGGPPGGVINESNEGNNCGAWTAVNLTAPPAPGNPSSVCTPDGTSVTLSWTASPGADNYYVRLQDGISPGPPAGFAGYTDGYTTTSITYPVVAGRAYSWWVHSNIGAPDYNSSHYSSATNGGFTCTAAAQANLTPISLTPSTIVAGTPSLFTATLSNPGTANTPSFSSTIYVCAANDAACVGNSMAFANHTWWEKVLAYVKTAVAYAANSTKVTLTGSPIAAGTQGTQTGTYTAPAPGSYTMRLCADLPLNQVAESNENDNCGNWQVLAVCPSGNTVAADGSCVAPVGTLSCTPSPTSLPASGGRATWTVTPGGGATGPYTWTPSGFAGYTTVSPASVYHDFVAADAGSQYTMTVSNGSITQACSPAVPVGTVCTGSPTGTITANPTRVKQGTSVTSLTVSAVQNVKTTCVVTAPGYTSNVISSNACTTSATNPVTPAPPAINTQTTYTLSCDGVKTASVVVNVLPAFKEF